MIELRVVIFAAVASAVVGFVPLDGARASGFALRESSATGQGNAFAGATASAEDISYMAFNPAGITRHPGEHAAFNVTAIDVRANFTNSGSTTVLGGTLNGGNGSDGAADVLVPAIYYSRQLTPKLFGGISLTVPFGLETHYDSGWVGRYHALKSSIRTYDLNPVLAYKVTPGLSVAGGRSGRLHARCSHQCGGFWYARPVAEKFGRFWRHLWRYADPE